MTQTEYALPALKLDRQGKRCVDYRTIAVLALPLFLDSLTYIAVGLTDTWFIGLLSTDATAAVGAIHWLMFVSIMLFACVGVVVQTQVAQAYGAGKLPEAARITWMGLWAAGLTIPVYGWLSTQGAILLAPFHLEPQIQALALLYWFPRMLSGPVVVADWTLRGFFNATNRTHWTFVVSGIVCLLNAAGNELLMFQLGWGIAGAAWATVISQSISAGIQLWLFLRSKNRSLYQTNHVWQPDGRRILQILRLGLLSGLFMAADLIGLACFQIMQVELGVISGAATQIVMTLLALAYQPVVGVGEAAIILVGQSLGAGDRAWARRVGNTVIRFSAGYMLLWGIGLALAGPWAVAPFVSATDPHALEVTAVACRLLWIAASYQLFHALTISASFCLQGAGDVQFPALLSLSLCLFGFIPMAHSLTFSAGQGWVAFLPQFGLGVWGGWAAYAGYMVILGSLLKQRWQARL